MKRTDRDHTKLAPALSTLRLAVGMVFFYAPGSALGQDETTVLFVATSDAYVSSDTPDGNYGSTEDLRTDTDPAQISYLKFNVSIPMGGIVAGAKLRLYTSTEATQSGVFVYAVGVTGWNQSTITYSTRPEVGAQLGSTGGWSDGPSWKEASLSSSSIDSGPFALAVEASNTWPKVFGSRESANDPILEVTYTTDPADPAPNCIGEPPDHPEVDYPEQRVFLESQGWWGERINGDVPKYGDAEHLHIGACFPLQQTVSGTVRMDFRVVAHNAPEGSLIERTRFHDGGDHHRYVPDIVWNRIVGANEVDVVEWEENVQVDTTLLQDGLRETRPLTFLIRPNGAEIHVSGGWCWNIQNIPGTADDVDPREFCTRKITKVAVGTTALSTRTPMWEAGTTLIRAFRRGSPMRSVFPAGTGLAGLAVLRITSPG